ncbi:tetratricopeptide repeat protein [Yeosuana marina]|uniref:tetratricopeptide repeat protein n=1 Tax=Yeosuana marina TaxID=1565536 RepID=UPI0014202561|nr:tetratricopeptide repeat protein [Yeosuana marina]
MRVLFFLLIITVLSACSKHIDYSQEYMDQTSGRYLYNDDEVIDVYYKNKKLYLKWKGAKQIEPVILDENTFFVADMFSKLRFVEQPETKQRYLSVVSDENENSISYDYLKVADSFKTPTMLLKRKEYDKALLGYLEIQKKDSTSVFINEGDFNKKGYSLLREKKYNEAIQIFKINVALHPESDNVYDSLAEAYLKSGDSLQAFNNYKKALELNSGNKRAKDYVNSYKE